MSISAAVEEADIELCASGFDNLVMYGDLDELHQHTSNMKLLGAMKCHAVINELIDWIASHPELSPLDVLDSDPERTNAIWSRYNDASCEENPRQRAIEHERE
jgi:hypothetical protein